MIIATMIIADMPIVFARLSGFLNPKSFHDTPLAYIKLSILFNTLISGALWLLRDVCRQFVVFTKLKLIFINYLFSDLILSKIQNE
jgi:hypothetical protein